MAFLSEVSPRGRWSLAGIAAFVVLTLAALLGPAGPVAATSPPTGFTLSPDHAPATCGVPIEITGTNLGQTTSVKFGTKDATIVSKSATKLVVICPAGTEGTEVDVFIIGPDGSGAPKRFRYDRQLAIPTVTSLSPDHGQPRGGYDVQLTGTNLASVVTVKFGANIAPIKSKTATTAIVTAPMGVQETSVGVTATNADGISAPVAFRYDAHGDGFGPTVTELTPARGPTSGGNDVVLSGSQLEQTTNVTFGGRQATIKVKTATSVVVTAPAGIEGSVDVVAVDATGVSRAVSYTYEGPPPHASVSAIAPDHGAVAGGDAVRITGTNLTMATKVTFGGREATITAKTATTLDVVTPPGVAAGAQVDVVVTTENNLTAAVKFTYDALPQPVLHAYEVSGSASLKALTRGTFAVGGTADLTFDDQGGVRGPITLRDTTARLVTAGLIPLTAKLGFVPAGDAVGTLDDTGALKLAYRARIKVKELKLFGTVSLAVGSNCQTRSAALIPLAAAVFDPETGGALAGMFSLSNLTGCGALNGLVSPLTSGTGNTIAVKLAPRSVAT